MNEKVSISELIKELLDQYDGEKHGYLMRVINQIIKTTEEKAGREYGMTLKKLRYLDGKLLSLRAANAISNSKDEALELIQLLKRAKEIGLSFSIGYKDEHELIKGNK